MDETTVSPSLAMSLTPDEVELSVIVPLYDEEANVPVLYERLREAADALGRSYELILINDGSTDRTGDLIEALADEDDHVIAISFPRNFGQTAALLAGIDHAHGRVIVPMDGDLQNDPADIRRLLEKLDEGYDVVSGWRQDRRDPWSKVLPSRIANAVISRASGVRLHDYGCSLKAYRREVLEGVDLYGEMHRFVPIYATWRGARVTEIPVTHYPRTQGRTKYGLERVVKVLLDLIVVKFLTSYLTKPIYIFGGFGMLNIALAAAALAAAIVFKLVPQDNPWGPGWHKDFVETPLPVASVGLLLLGIQMILIGLLAEMLMRTYYESQGKRAYVISSIRRRPREQVFAARRAG
jgi:glycosyltransferase involved in cell wall biosynthesis